MRSEEVTDAASAMTQVRQEEMQEGTTSATAMMLPEHMTLVLTLPTVHLGGQVPTRSCPLIIHMHLTLQTYTRQLRAFTNKNPLRPVLARQLQASTNTSNSSVLTRTVTLANCLWA